MVNLIDDIGVLTTVSPTNLKAISKLSEAVICHAVAESMLDRNQVTEIDIGIGMLYIRVTDGEIQYKFAPSEHLYNSMLNTVKTGKSPIEAKVNEQLGKRIMNTYKDLF